MSRRPLMYRIARMRSGRFLEIPDSINRSECGEFLSQFSIDERVDILCLTECLTQRFAKQRFVGKGHKGVTMVDDTLRSQIEDSEFANALSQLGLTYSLNYIRFGEHLLQW